MVNTDKRKALFLKRALKMNEKVFRDKYKSLCNESEFKADLDALVYSLTGRLPNWDEG